MLARYLHPRPVRYAQHPLSLWTRFALTRPELMRSRQYLTPGTLESHDYRPDFVAKMHPLFQAVAQGEHQAFVPLIHALTHAGAGVQHWAEQFGRLHGGQEPYFHDAFTEGHPLDEIGTERTREVLDPMLRTGGLFRDVRPLALGAQRMRKLTPLLHSAQAYPHIQDLLDLHETLFGMLHPHGHQVVEDATHRLNRVLGAAVGGRLDAARGMHAEGLRQQQGRDDRPMETVPEDWYAL